MLATELSTTILEMMNGIRGFNLPIYGKNLLGLATYNGIKPSDDVVSKTCFAFAKYIINEL